MTDGPRRGSLSMRLALAFVAVALAAVAALAVVIVLTTRSETSRLSAGDRARTAQEAARVLADAYRRAGTWASADLTGARLVASAADAGLVVRDASGIAVQGAGGRFGRGPGHGAAPTVTARPITVAGQRVGTAELHFRQSLSAGQSLLRSRLFDAVLLGCGIAVAIALLGAGLVSRAITGPLRRLASATRRLASGDVAARSEAASAPGELGELARTFDAMAGALDRERESRRRQVSELAHEVRTPIAVLQGNLEELVDGMAQATPQRLASLHEEVVRLGALVQDLDALAHADQPLTGLERSPVALDELARAQLDALSPRLQAKGLVVRQQLSPVTVPGDPARLGQVLANLLSNAVKFTPEGGQITVAVDTVDGHGRLSVSDSGPGVPDDERERVFERFWRGSAGRGVSGRGIGLAVAADITRAHGGRVVVEGSDEGGARFVVTLPVA